jgi:NAD-dependent deacetylase sirtuin 4
VNNFIFFRFWVLIHQKLKQEQIKDCKMAARVTCRSVFKFHGLAVQSAIRAFSSSLQALAKILHEPNLRFVPKSSPVLERDVKVLADFIEQHKRVLVITGAGISTASGIPDYRSEGVGLYSRSENRPIQYTEFLKSEKNRRRYWARNYVGWPRFSSVFPNIGHKILSDWEKRKKLSWLVTQNVDALHHKAGSRNMTELHGSSHRVECLQCGSGMTRNCLQELIRDKNPHFHEESLDIAPDGDVQLSDFQVRNFQVSSVPH